jgi:serine/threonine protein kinase
MRKDPQKFYKLEELIGKGAHASVYRGINLEDKRTVAIKVVNILRMSDTALASALNEIRILSSIDNPYVVQYYESFVDKEQSQLWIVMELMEGGDLNGYIEKAVSGKKPISEKTIWLFFIQALAGLKALHNLNIIHRDLKPGNVYLTADKLSIKLGDMNVSKITDFSFAQSLIGSPAYLAPEVWMMRPYTNTCDIFSLGCLIYELASFKLPFDAENFAELRNNILNLPAVKIPPQYSGDLQSLINKCLLKNPDLRPKANQLVSHPIIRKKAKELGINFASISYANSLTDHISVPKNRFLLNLQLPKKVNGKLSVGKNGSSFPGPQKKKQSSTSSITLNRSKSPRTSKQKQFKADKSDDTNVNTAKVQFKSTLTEETDEKTKDSTGKTLTNQSKECLLEKLADFGMDEYIPIRPKKLLQEQKNAVSADTRFLDRFFAQTTTAKAETISFVKNGPFFQKTINLDTELKSLLPQKKTGNGGKTTSPRSPTELTSTFSKKRTLVQKLNKGESDQQ